MSGTQTPSPDQPSVRFHSRCAPPLAAGPYRLQVRHQAEQLHDDEAKCPFESALDFVVGGPRFALDPADVYSVHPPKGHVGDYAETLPHIVLSRRTLPWERTIDETQETPWLALLVLGPADFPGASPPEVAMRPLRALVNPGPDGMGPAIELDDNDPLHRQDDLCATLDLPAELFRRVAPRAVELCLLAHVREVHTGAKETSSLLTDGWFSVVVANRQPEHSAAGGDPVENRVFLISVEGLAGELDGSDVQRPAQFVRMAVLAHWSFRCEAGTGVASALRNLDSSALAVPWRNNGTAAPNDDQVKNALAMGYMALDHRTRWGESAVSWYRGPLVPVALRKESEYAFRPAADAALRYGPDDGMFDVSYAAAYQLGRLLALQDRHFVVALQGFRQRVRRRVNEMFGRHRLRREVGGPVDADSPENLLRNYLARLGADAEVPAESDGDHGSPSLADPDAPEKGGTLHLTSDFDLRIPLPVCRWLGRSMLLYRVPFAYLVPDERMLPPASIRFFRLDPSWLAALLQGACSVGRSSDRDTLADGALRHAFLDFALEHALTVRDGDSPSRDMADAPVAQADKARRPNWPLTGFLLRSPVVEGWQGLEMRAWADREAKTPPLAPLRIDRLARDIMFCIFDGEVARMEVSQPPEGLHFGFGGRKKNPCPRDGAAPRVLDLAEFAAENAAALARDLVDHPIRAVFQAQGPGG